MHEARWAILRDWHPSPPSAITTITTITNYHKTRTSTVQENALHSNAKKKKKLFYVYVHLRVNLHCSECFACYFLGFKKKI